MSSTLERIVREYYPIGTTIVNFLHTWDQIALKHASKTLLALVGSADCPCLDASFFDATGADPRCLAKIDLWEAGYFWKDGRMPDVRRGPALNDSEARCVDLFDWRQFMEEWKVLKQVRCLGIERVTNLCLDTTRVRDGAVRFFLSEMCQLRVLSLRYCYGVSLTELAKTVRNLKPARLKKLNIWNLFHVKEMQYSPVTNTTPKIPPTVLDHEFAAISLLSETLEIDVAFCECTQSLRTRRPAQIVNRTCAMCNRSEISRDCSRCVITRSCESCMDYYCRGCNPWCVKRSQLADPRGVIYEEQRTRRQDAQGILYWVSFSEPNAILVVTKTCNSRFCEVSLNTHYYHAGCIPKFEDMQQRCSVCRIWQCPHDPRAHHCSVCERFFCFTCGDGNLLRCNNCDQLACEDDMQLGKVVYPTRGAYGVRQRRVCTPCQEMYAEADREMGYASIGPQKVITIRQEFSD